MRERPSTLGWFIARWHGLRIRRGPCQIGPHVPRYQDIFLHA
jgi:hypothetical protein